MLAGGAHGALVGETKQLDHTLGVVWPVQRRCYPAAVGQHVMRPGTAGGDQLVSHLARERQVGDPLAMQMPELTTPKTEFNPTKPMRTGLVASSSALGVASSGTYTAIGSPTCRSRARCEIA